MEINESVKMTFPNKLNYIPFVQRFVREIATMIGFSGDEMRHIDIAVDEAVSNIMVHTIEEENPTSEIICEKIPGGMKIILKDMAIPFDPMHLKRYELSKDLHDISGAGLGIYLIRKMMDDLLFRNLGTGGKETIMIKYLPDSEALKEHAEAAMLRQIPEIISEKIEYDVRGLEEDEAIEVSRCAYKTHGYTFFDDHIYYPERLVEMNRTSEMISAVAVTKNGTFMGHGALLYQYPDDTIAELTFIFVNVEFRGQGALNRLIDYLFQVTKKRELRGAYSYSVTNHLFTQKSMIKCQLRDCGILLATSPASWKFKGIPDEADQRITVALSFRFLIQPVQKTIYAPEHHAVMIRRLYENLGANNHYLVPAVEKFLFQQQESELKTGINELESCAEIFVTSFGADFNRSIRKALRGFCLQQIACINLFLRLEDPLTFWLTGEIEKMGFFFAGILPETRIGDALILQYLNNVDLDYDKLHLLTDIANDLLAYIKDHDPNIII